MLFPRVLVTAWTLYLSLIHICTPLTSINLLVERLSASGLPDECRHQLTNELYELLDRIAWLITTLLKISKLDAGTVSFNKDTVSLETLINQSCSPLLIRCV